MRAVLLLALLSVAFSPRIMIAEDEIAFEVFNRRIQRARAEYRFAKSKEIAGNATHVRLYLLDATSHPKEWKQGYGSTWWKLGAAPFAKQISVKELNVHECDELVALLSKNIAKQDKELGFGAICHFPTHGVEIVRISSNADVGKCRNVVEESILSCSISVLCENIVLKYPIGTEGCSLDVALRSELVRLLPFPENERQRFEDWMHPPQY